MCTSSEIIVQLLTENLKAVLLLQMNFLQGDLKSSQSRRRLFLAMFSVLSPVFPVQWYPDSSGDLGSSSAQPLYESCLDIWSSVGLLDYQHFCQAPELRQS